MKKLITFALALCLCGQLAACAGISASDSVPGRFILGDTTFSPEHEEYDINPHNAYSGWACIRYGVGETLFRYSDSMTVEPWLAESFENVDEYIWEIQIRDNVVFSNGKTLDAQAVKECLEHLLENHARANADLAIEQISADRQTLTIRTAKPNPTLINSLSDPYACIIDIQAGITDDGIVIGTGPYAAISVTTGQFLELTRNENYWNGTPGYEEIQVRTITDGDTLTMSLQSGEIDAAYGMPYASHPLFQNDRYSFTSATTSRAFFLHMNFESPVIQDSAVRKAIAMSIDKEGFTSTLLHGNGTTATGAFPTGFMPDNEVHAAAFDPDAAKAILEQAGWIDSNGDGIREKDGVPLSLRWLTYPSRQELPLLAQSAQANLKQVGIEIKINCTADSNSFRRDPFAWDIYASAMVTAPTGDPQYFFTTHCLDAANQNNGHYHNDRLEALASQLLDTFDPQVRRALAAQMQQILLDDNAFVFCAHLKMTMIAKSSVTGLVAHPCDYYEITADLKPAN